MSSSDLEKLKLAYEAANEGDVDAIATLFRPDTVWRGVERGHLWWRKAPG